MSELLKQCGGETYQTRPNAPIPTGCWGAVSSTVECQGHAVFTRSVYLEVISKVVPNIWALTNSAMIGDESDGVPDLRVGKGGAVPGAMKNRKTRAVWCARWGLSPALTMGRCKVAVQAFPEQTQRIESGKFGLRWQQSVIEEDLEASAAPVLVPASREGRKCSKRSKRISVSSLFN